MTTCASGSSPSTSQHFSHSAQISVHLRRRCRVCSACLSDTLTTKFATFSITHLPFSSRAPAHGPVTFSSPRTSPPEVRCCHHTCVSSQATRRHRQDNQRRNRGDG